MADVSPLPLPFDVVESVLSLLPAADLLSASDVSTTWRHAANSSPRQRRRPPSLLFHSHTLRHRRPTTTSTSLLDPLSPSSWLHLPPLPSPPSPLHSSSSPSLLYTLTSSQLSFSSDPLHLRWTHLPSPSVWRLDPLVSLVGPFLVVVGGVSEFFDDDPLSVEVFHSREWKAARCMPEAFACSASSRFLSAAVAGGRLYVIERRSGLLCSFNPEEGTWSETTELLADVKVKPFALSIAGSGNKVVLAGVLGEAKDVKGLRLWEMGSDEMGLVEIGEMPEGMVERFARGAAKDSVAGVSAVEVRTAAEGEVVYVYNPSDMGEVFYMRKGGDWGCVESPVERGWSPTKTIAVTCSPVTIKELREALR